MNSIKQSNLPLRKVLAFFAMTIFSTTLLNLPQLLFTKGAEAATALQYNLTPLTTTEVSGGATNFKVMEFVIQENSNFTQDTLVYDALSTSVAGNALTDFPANTKFYGGTTFSSSSAIILDLDNDGVFTGYVDTLIDADGTATSGAGATSLSGGTALSFVTLTDRLFTNSKTSPGIVWKDNDNDNVYTSAPDIFIDGDGYLTSGSGDIGGISAGSSLRSFENNDKLYYYNASGTSVLDGIDDIQGLWLDDGDGTFEDSTKASIKGTELSFGTAITLTSGVDDSLSIQYAYMNGVSGISTSTKTLDLTPGGVGSAAFSTIDELVTAINTAIGASGFSTVTDFNVTADTGALKFETRTKGYGTALSITGTSATKLKLGLDTVATVTSSDTLIYESSSGVITAGVTAGTIVLSGSGVGLRYRDSGVNGSYQPGEDIFIDQYGRTYSASADDLIRGAETIGSTPRELVTVSDQWVQEDSTYNVGDDLFIESIPGKKTYSAAMDQTIKPLANSQNIVGSGSQLLSFPTNTRFYNADGDSPAAYDVNEDVYLDSGNCTGSCGSQYIDYETLDAITVELVNLTNAASMSQIERVKMYYEPYSPAAMFNANESYVEFQIPSNGSANYWHWNKDLTSLPKIIQLPDYNSQYSISPNLLMPSLKVYITIDTKTTATEGQKIQFQIPSNVDTGTYNLGDKGIYVSTGNNGPTDTVLISSIVTISAFGDLVSTLDDKLGDFENQIDDVKLRTSKSSFDDYNDDIDDEINELEDILANTIDTNSEVTSIFDSLSNIIDAVDGLVGLVPTGDTDGVSSRDYKDTKDALGEVEDAMDALVNTLGTVIGSTQQSKYDDENDQYGDEWKDTNKNMKGKNPDATDLSGVKDSIDDYTDDLNSIKENDLILITTKTHLSNTYDDIADIINDAIDEIEALDETKEYDEDDLDDLEDSIGDLRDAFESLTTSMEDRLTVADTANGNTDLNKEYDRKDYEGDMTDLLDDLDDAFDKLKGGGTDSSVTSQDAEDAVDEFDDIINDIEDTDDGVSAVTTTSQMKSFMGDLEDYVGDIQDVIDELPCTISEDDLSDVEDSMDDAKNAVEDARDALKASLQTRSLYAAMESDFTDAEDDLDSAFDDLDESWDELDKLEGRCEDTDTSGPATIAVVASDYELLANNEGVDTAELVATVRDREGKALSNRVINFQISSPLTNQGKLSGTAVRTDDLGQAKIEYTPGKSTSGTVTVKAYSTTNTDVSGTVQLKVFSNVDASTNDSDDEDSSDDSDETDSEEEVEERVNLTPTKVTDLKVTAKSGAATIDSEIENKRLDFSSGLADATSGDKVGDMGVAKAMANIIGQNVDSLKKIKITAKSGEEIAYTRDDLNVIIESGTTIYGDKGWDGKIEPPTDNTDVTEREGYDVKTVISVGDNNGSLLFDKPVKLEIPSELDGDVYYTTDGDIWQKISECKDATADEAGSLAFPNECYVAESSSIVIWTYHFTEFAVMSETDESSDDVSSGTISKITVLEKVLDPAKGGSIKLEVKDADGEPVSNEVVVVSMRNNVTKDIKTYSGKSNDKGEITISVPQTDFAANTEYAVIATAGDASSGIFAITAGTSGTNTGEGATGRVLGADDDKTAGTAGSAGSLPQTGLIPIFTFIFSAVGSYLLIFRRKIACLEN